MKNLLHLLLLVIIGNLYAQSNLPNCQGGDVSKWTNCYGSTTFTNGDLYVGDFKSGKYHGYGTYTFVSGAKYVGEYRDGTYHGQGTYTFASGENYIGEHRNGKRNGQGVMTLANGNKYIGGYKDNNLDGQGTIYAANGSILNQGIWADGKLIRSESNQPSITSNTEFEKVVNEVENTRRRQTPK